MSPETQEFGAIYTEIQKEFDNDPTITVTPTAGHPPSQYEVVYAMPSAVKSEQGKVVIESSHVITISIPFGYPHFSPSCKPKSPIFHPDFDSAAICLGNYWNRERTLPELIRHIGRMISGELYSTENPFNEEALQWFNDNSAKLPFAPSSEKPESPAPKLTLEKTDDDGELDILEDQDFIDEIDELDFADNEDLAAADSHEFPPPPPPEPAAGPDVDSLLQLMQLKNFNELEDELASIDPSVQFPERDELEARTSSALNEARELYSIAGEFEDAGNSEKALEAYRSVEDLVADFPNIRDDIVRAEQSAEMLSEINGSFAEPHGGDESEPFPFSPDEIPEVSDPPVEAPRKPEKKEQKQTKFFEDERAKKSLNLVPLVAAGAGLCIVVTLTYYYFSLTGKLTEAKQLFSECSAQFAAKDFTAAEKSCLASMDTTTNIILVHQGDKQELQSSIRQILNSEELRQGLLGNILHNGRYVPKSLLEAHQSFSEASTRGNESFKAKQWTDAIQHYQTAINIARRTKDIPPTDLLKVENALKEAQFFAQYEKAQEAIEKENWQQALNILEDLNSDLSSDDPIISESRDKIKALMAKGEFAQLKKQADELFQKSDWSGAFDMFQKAIQAGRSLSEAEPDTLDTLQQNVAKAELYSTINEGNSAFSSGQWDLAISKYQMAKVLLSQKGDLLNLKDKTHSINKLDRIILQSALLRERQSADRHREEGNLDAALRNLQDMVNHIKYGNFSTDPEFQQTLREIQETQASLRDQLYTAELEQYLVDNYKRLFIENYPAASPDTLIKPSATYVKRVGSQYLFRMECTESGRGRPLKLVMFYTYNPVNEQWKFHSGDTQ